MPFIVLEFTYLIYETFRRFLFLIESLKLVCRFYLKTKSINLFKKEFRHHG